MRCAPHRSPSNAFLRRALFLAAALAISTQARATEFVVTSMSDDGSPGTLRATILATNAAPGSNTITIPAGTITLASALPSISGNNILIKGAGAGQTIVQGGATANDSGVNWRVFTTTFGPEVTIEDMTIRHGHINISGAGIAQGGGIHNGGILTLNNVTVSDNVASSSGTAATDGNDARGGGISNAGTLQLTNCTISGNQAVGQAANGDGGDAFGGGIFTPSACIMHADDCAISNNLAVAGPGLVGGGSAEGGGTHNADGSNIDVGTSTISGNQALGSGGGATNGSGNGGGAYLGTASLSSGKFELCTISGNTAGPAIGSGGGLYAGVNTKISSCTISANLAATTSSGGGIFVPASAPADGPYIRNSIIAGNTAAGSPNDLRGRIDSRGFNLIQSFFALGDIDTSTGSNTATGNQLSVDPLLGAFGLHGGRTQTYSLEASSPAINAGTHLGIDPSTTRGGPPTYTTDQRGYPRIVDGQADIGSFESGGAPSGAVGADRYR